MDSVPRVDHDDQEWFASRHRGHLNQKARLHWEDEAKGRVLYLSWRNLSWIWDDLVSTIHIVRKVLFIPFLPLLFPTLQQPWQFFLHQQTWTHDLLNTGYEVFI